ncbi:MAG TPA: hypothetical protein VFC73_08820 [Syntrophomonadaceae bacterium]|nr:hypothetical protein [Syntrophomonadaceae bacterium]
MDRLESKVGHTLTIMCTNISLPIYETNQIENKLLDGSLHIQTIGEPLKIFKVEVLSTKENAEKINEMQNIGEEIYLVAETRKYRGLIRKPIIWTMKGMYQGKTTKYIGEVELVILEEIT